MLIPDNFTDFLYWFKEVTETSWAKKGLKTDNRTSNSIAQWVGMSEPEIAQTERKYHIKFPPDFREFLKILHTKNNKSADDEHFFFNWLDDEQIIIDKLNNPYTFLFQDSIWLKSWGQRPDTQDAITKRFNEWYQEAPKLIPIFGHRYLVSEPCENGNPILSVRGSDTIIYGWNLKDYLLDEFREDMPDELFDKFYDEEDGSWNSLYKNEIQHYIDLVWLNSSYDDIPYWGELIKLNVGNWKYIPQVKLDKR